MSVTIVAGCGLPVAVGPQVSTYKANHRYHEQRPTSSYRVIFHFDDNDGAFPEADLINVHGTLLGTTLRGGRGCTKLGCGTVFSVTPAGQQRVLYPFGSPRSHGSDPAARLTLLRGTFYGTTERGGGIGAGTVFSVTASGKERVLHSFGLTPYDGTHPAGGLTVSNGLLYGTSETGGTLGGGTIYSITTLGTEKVLYNFQGLHGGPDGSQPLGDLLSVDGALYGTTISGGKTLSGTIFKVTASGSETVLHYFTRKNDGYYPEAGMIVLNGKFYGTTERGGDANLCRSSGQVGCGAVFEMTSQGKESILYRFKGGADGKYPFAPLVALNGALYGTTFAGGTGGFGTIFRVTTAGNESVLYSFGANPDAAYPYSGLTSLGGTLYGATSLGGTYGYGTVYALTP